VQISCPSDGHEVLVGSIRNGILATPRRKVDQRTQVGRSGELQSLGRIRATALAPGGQHSLGVGRPAIEAEHVAQVGKRVPGMGSITAHGQRHERTLLGDPRQ
jgi:hypothetical protein